MLSLNLPDVATLTPAIKLSVLVWGYVDKDGNEFTYTDAFVYTRVSGAAVEYSVKLINLPDALYTKGLVSVPSAIIHLLSSASYIAVTLL